MEPPKPQLGILDAMARNRKERRRLAKINHLTKIPSINNFKKQAEKIIQSEQIKEINL